MNSALTTSAPTAADELAADQVIVWRSEERDAETSAARHEQVAAAARGTARERKLMIGRVCVKQRAKWPASGPNARGWGEWLARAKLDDSTAWRYMESWKNRDKPQGGDVGDSSQSGGTRGKSGSSDNPANVHGGSGEVARGSFCTPLKWATAVGSWDLDPFGNPHSHIVAKYICMLENGGDGLGDPTVPGSYRFGPEHSDCIGRADETTRTFWQPPYERGFIARVVKHYGHTRFCALLRWAPDTKWFAAMWSRVQLVAFPLERIAFETPDGVALEGADDSDEDRGAPFPHAFYYADPRDVTPAIYEACIVLTRYQAAAQSALHIVR